MKGLNFNCVSPASVPDRTLATLTTFSSAPFPFSAKCQVLARPVVLKQCLNRAGVHWPGLLSVSFRFFRYLADAFDVLYEEGATSPKMMSIGLHCRIVGRPGYILSICLNRLHFIIGLALNYGVKSRMHTLQSAYFILALLRKGMHRKAFRLRIPCLARRN